MSNPFVRPDVVRIELSDHDWIDVKRELNAGEAQDVWADMVANGITPGEIAKLDPHRVGWGRALAYIVAWSFTDGEGRPAPIVEASLRAMRKHKRDELTEAIDRHEVAQRERLDDELKNAAGASSLRVVS